MKLVALVSLFCISLSFASTVNVDIAKEHQKAIDENKGLLVKMSASWCAPCRIFDKSVVSSDRFKKSIESNNIKFLEIDYTKGIKGLYKNRYVDSFGVALPTIILLSPEGLSQLQKGARPDKENFRIIKSRSLENIGRNGSIIKEIASAALDLRI